MSSLMKSGSESSLSEENVKSSVDRQKSNYSSTKEWRSEQQDEKETCSDTEECAPPVSSCEAEKIEGAWWFQKK
ncbi:uncharacterized protein isoform X1 [Leptinotarsa decemlineata]|uniref:uncharacterized protein isoform X1 n=1 Tax=Leptinotarsa decemlineata TaxID=7539 RepID=UPI003D30C20F